MYSTDIYVLITPTFIGSQNTHLMYVCLIHLACRTCDEFICRRHSSSCSTLWALGTAREDLKQVFFLPLEYTEERLRDYGDW